MAGLLMTAMIAPMLPALELPISFAAEGGGGSTTVNNYTYQTFQAGSHGELNVANSDFTSISGENQSISVSSENTQIIVNGDYYKETEQFNPRVAETWSGNYMDTNALWVPSWSELPTWFTSNVMRDRGYAALYTGFMEYDNHYEYKPYGATRIGETLGYDVYAKDGVSYDPSTGGGTKAHELRSDYQLLGNDDTVTKTWSVINIYRALGQEKYKLAIAPLKKLEHASSIAEIVGSAKLKETAIRNVVGEEQIVGLWDINRSPVVQFLSGNITAGYSGDSEPVVVVWASRTHPEDYIKQAEIDRLEYDYEPRLYGNEEISCAEFCRWVAYLMEAYGEPVITEMEQYMLLEAYGRTLPYDLYPAELEAVKYLMVRGIIDGTDELAKMAGADSGWSWYDAITFEQAATILMRVKDKGSRLTFKEIQLTTDISLLKRGFYPTEVAVTGQADGMFINELAYMPANESTHYDYFIRRSDNRALFLSSDEAEFDTTTTRLEVPGHVSVADKTPEARMPNSYYRGRTSDGWYWFQIPTNYEGAVYINSAHSEHDFPAQYMISQLDATGGYYIVDVNAGDNAGQDTPAGTMHVARQSGFGDRSPYVDVDNFARATQGSALSTAATSTADRKRVVMYTIQVHKRVVEAAGDDYELIGGPDGSTTSALAYSGSSKWLKSAQNLPRMGATDSTEPPVVYVRYGETVPKVDAPSPADEEKYIKCKLWRAHSTINFNSLEYLTFIVEADKPITKEMAQTAFNLCDPKLRAGLTRGDDTEAGSPMRTMRAYCANGSNYLVSVEYLKAQGVVGQFLNYAQGKYFMSSKGDVGGQTLDIYFDCKRGDTCLVIAGSTAYIYNAADMPVNQMGDDTYVLLSAITGKFGNNQADTTAPDGSVVLSLKNPGLEANNHKSQDAGYNIANTGKTLIVGGKETIPISTRWEWSMQDYIVTTTAMYVDLSRQNTLANYITVFDRRNGEAAPKVFTLYETGSKVEDSKSAEARQWFEELFGWSVGGDSVYYKMVQGTPEVSMLPDGSFVPISGDGDASKIRYSETGNLLVKIPVVAWSDVPTLSKFWSGVAGVDDTPYAIVPYVYDDNSGKVYSWLTNWYTGGNTAVSKNIGFVNDNNSAPNRMDFDATNRGLSMWPKDLTEHRDTLFDIIDHFESTASDVHLLSDSDTVKLQVMGLPAMLANFTVETADKGTKMSSILKGVKTVIVYFGCDKDGTAYAINDNGLPFDAKYWVLHLSGDAVVLQVYNGEVTPVNRNSGASESSEKEWSASEPNKIFDWLMWLKAAKLSDAEDILTICIIAVLQWLPRIFMFIFFVLMGLSMIASMKPWIIFCDRFFDPYKFLTGGRMDVHTVEIKKVVLCSMIALILFGFFQNGLILDIIAWCARAVTGMLNR